MKTKNLIFVLGLLLELAVLSAGSVLWRLLDYEEFHHRPPRSGKNMVYLDDHVSPLDVSAE